MGIMGIYHPEMILLAVRVVVGFMFNGDDGVNMS
jgi:hypothetical protein